MAYTVKVVDKAGSIAGTLANARVGKVSWELNGAGSADFTLATTDPDAALAAPGKEIQIFNGATLVWWGVIVRPQAGLRETTWQCAGLLWYFGHRFMGRADRLNLLTNGDFEAGETSWSFTSVTHAIDSTHFEGTQSEKLTGTAADHVGHATQVYTHTTQYSPGGDAVTVSAWVYVPSVGYVGGAISDFGLVARHLNAAGLVLEAQVVTIDDDTVQDTWIPMEVLLINVKAGDTVEVLLFPPHGIAYYDLVTLTLMESLSLGYPDGLDAASIVAEIVDYAQDNGAFTHGKSDLNIGTAGAATGTLLVRVYQFAEHRNIGDALIEFTRLGILDFDIVITTTTRTFTTYAKSADARTPKLGKGALYGTTLELDVNLAGFTYSFDGEQGASSVVLLGPGDGPDRPEGGAVDSGFLAGAYTMEIVESAPDDATVGELDNRAIERLAVAARPEILEVTTLPGSGVIGNLQVGDTVPIDISHGWVVINDVYRVARIEADLLMDQATISLNPIP